MSMTRIHAGVAVLALTAVASCGPSPASGGFDAHDPASKLYAIERAMRENDTAAIPRIVEQLDSDDPAVRLMSISALKQMTGETLGYDPGDTAENRRPAIKAWLAAVDSGRFSNVGAPHAQSQPMEGGS